MTSFDESTKLRPYQREAMERGIAAVEAMKDFGKAMVAFKAAAIDSTTEMQRFNALVARRKVESYMVMRDGEPTLRADLAKIVDDHHQQLRRTFKGTKVQWENRLVQNTVALKLWLRSL